MLAPVFTVDRELGVAVEAAEALLAEHLAAGRAQAEVAVGVVRRRPHPRGDRVACGWRVTAMVWCRSFQPVVLRTQPLPVPVRARPAPWSAPQLPGAGPRREAGLSNPPLTTGWSGGGGGGGGHGRRLEHGEHAGQRVVEGEVPAAEVVAAVAAERR